jgi:RNA polymerase sigma-70 factor, ECF subfamily
LVGTLDQIFREEWGRILASLSGILGDFDLAEEAAQGVFAIADDRPRLPGAGAHYGAAAGAGEAKDQSRLRRARQVTDDGAERRFLERRLAELAGTTDSGW